MTTGHDGRGGKQIGHARRTVFDVGGKRAVGGSGSRGQANRRGRGTPAGNVRRRGCRRRELRSPGAGNRDRRTRDVPPLLEIVTPVPAGNAAFRNKPVKATVPGATDSVGLLTTLAVQTRSKLLPLTIVREAALAPAIVLPARPTANRSQRY